MTQKEEKDGDLKGEPKAQVHLATNSCNWTTLLQQTSALNLATDECSNVLQTLKQKPHLLFVPDQNFRTALSFAVRARSVEVVHAIHEILGDTIFAAMCKVASCFSAQPKTFIVPLEYLDKDDSEAANSVRKVLADFNAPTKVPQPELQYLARCDYFCYCKDSAVAAMQQVPALDALIKSKAITLDNKHNAVYHARTPSDIVNNSHGHAFAGPLPPRAFKFAVQPVSDKQKVDFPSDDDTITAWHGPSKLAQIVSLVDKGLLTRAARGVDDSDGRNHPCPDVVYTSRNAAVPCAAYAPHITTFYKHPERKIDIPQGWRVILGVRVRRNRSVRPGFPSDANGKERPLTDTSKPALSSVGNPQGFDDKDAVVIEKNHFEYCPLEQCLLPGVVAQDRCEMWVKRPSHVVVTGVILVPWPAYPKSHAGQQVTEMPENGMIFQHGMPFHGNTDVFCAGCHAPGCAGDCQL